MAAVFLKLLNLSISASWLVLAVLGTAPDIKAFAQVDECSALGHRRAAAYAAIFHRKCFEPDPQCRNGQSRGRAV